MNMIYNIRVVKSYWYDCSGKHGEFIYKYQFKLYNECNIYSE